MAQKRKRPTWLRDVSKPKPKPKNPRKKKLRPFIMDRSDPKNAEFFREYDALEESEPQSNEGYVFLIQNSIASQRERSDAFYTSVWNAVSKHLIELQTNRVKTLTKSKLYSRHHDVERYEDAGLHDHYQVDLFDLKIHRDPSASRKAERAPLHGKVQILGAWGPAFITKALIARKPMLIVSFLNFGFSVIASDDQHIYHPAVALGLVRQPR